MVLRIARHPLAWYFGCAYALSVLGLLILGPPRLTDGGKLNLTSLVVFPFMVVGIGLVGVLLTRGVEGRQGLTDLARRWLRLPKRRWWLALAVPPAGILAILILLSWLVSPDFRPGLLWFGAGFGLLAGFFEEFGWTGFAYPRLSARFGWLGGAALLGVLWGVWHLPVVDSLGAAGPHGHFWPLFFIAFVGLVAAVRVIIGWLYTNTGSLLLAQSMHASSTGFLVILGASHVTAGEEAVWYLCYAALLWVFVAALVVRLRIRVPAFA